MEHDALLDLVPLYAYGVLSDDERRALESHLADGCAECDAALREAREVAGALATAVAPIDPSPRVWQDLRARVAAAPARSAPARSRSWVPIALAASLATALALGGLAWQLAKSRDAARQQVASVEREIGGERTRRADAERELAALRAEIEQVRSEGRETQGRSERLQELVRLLTAPETRTIALAGQESAPSARAQAFLNAGARQLLLFVYDLPPTPPGQTYQLWVIVGGKPVSAGVFEIDAEGRARHEGFTPPDVTGPVTIAVSVEPAGGVPAPTGPIVLAGS